MLVHDDVKSRISQDSRVFESQFDVFQIKPLGKDVKLLVVWVRACVCVAVVASSSGQDYCDGNVIQPRLALVNHGRAPLAKLAHSGYKRGTR